MKLNRKILKVDASPSKRKTEPHSLRKKCTFDLKNGTKNHVEFQRQQDLITEKEHLTVIYNQAFCYELDNTDQTLSLIDAICAVFPVTRTATQVY